MKKEKFEWIMFSVKMMNIILILGIITAIWALWYFWWDVVFEHLLKKFRFYSKISKDYLWIIWSLYLVLLFVYYFVLVHFLWKTLKNINNWTILDNKNLINILFTFPYNFILNYFYCKYIVYLDFIWNY